jgi:Xaa-Pro aminopeptidase
MDLNFSDMALDFDALDVLPGYNLSQHSSRERLSQLRQLMKERGIEGYLIVDSDAHYTFYAQARQDRRINYITRSEVPPPLWGRAT